MLLVGTAFAFSVFASIPSATPNLQMPLLSSPGSVWWVGADSTDSSALPNTGVDGTIQVISTPVVGCLAFWVSDDLSNSVWGQVGYYICNTNIPIAFYQIWSLSNNTILTSGSTTVSVGTHTFSMYLQSGTTWAYSLDGTVFGTYNMGASVSSSTYPVYALSEEEANSTFAFPAVTFGTAMNVRQSSSWSAVSYAKSYGTSWGMEGNAQSSSIPNNEIVVGGSTGTLAAGTALWGSPGTTTTTSSTSTATLPPVTTTVTSTVTSSLTSTSTQTLPASTTTVTTTASPTTTTSTKTSTVTSTATSTATSTVTSISTQTLPASTTTATVTTTSPPRTTTTTQTSTQTSTVTSTVTGPATTSTTTVTSTSPPSTTTTTQTTTSKTTVTSTITGGTVTTTVTTTSPTTVTQTATSTVTSIGGPTATATTTVTQTSTEPGTTSTVTLTTTADQATATVTETSTVNQTTTVTNTVTSTSAWVLITTQTETLPGTTTTLTSTPPQITQTDTVTSTMISPPQSTPTVTATATTTVCDATSNEANVPCQSSDPSAAGPPTALLGEAMFGFSAVGAGITIFVIRRILNVQGSR